MKQSPEPRVKNVCKMWGEMARKDGRQIPQSPRGGGLTSHDRALPVGYLRPLIWHWLSTTRSPYFPTPHEGGTGKAAFWGQDWEPNHIGPHSRVPPCPLVSLGGDLPDQAQVSDSNELCNPLYTVWDYFSEAVCLFHLHSLITFLLYYYTKPLLSIDCFATSHLLGGYYQKTY